MRNILTLLLGVGLALGISGCDDDDPVGGGAGGEGGMIGAGGAGGSGEGGSGEGGSGEGGSGEGGMGGEGPGGAGGDGEGGMGGEGPGGAGGDGEGGMGGEGPGGAGGDGEGGMGGEGPGGAGGDGEGGMGGEGGGALDCDQPDPATCDAAGCVWTRSGCLPGEDAHPCYSLNEVVCQSRAECVWNGQWCEPDPAQLPCVELQIAECANRDAECAWTGERCVDRPEGPCAELNEEQCSVRRDCQAQYSGDDCACACPPEEPDCECGCEQQFEACGPRVLNCREVPIDACEQTPGCAVEMVGDERFCLPEDPNGCADRQPGVCEADGRCQLESVEVCDEGGAIPPRPAPPGDELIEPPPPPCREELRCRPADAVVCDGLEPDLCAAQPGCQIEEREVCDCGGPEPVDPPPERRPAPPDPCPCEIEQVCVEIPACEDINNINECREANGCGWGVARPEAPECQACPECPFGAECLIIAPPECPQDCYGCLPQMPEAQCGDWMDARNCQADRDCEWQPGQGECACFIDENGREICECDEIPGQCVDRVQGCEELQANACNAREDCIFGTPIDCPPCDGPECPCLAEFPERCMTAEDYCDGMNAEICGRDPNCQFVEQCADGRDPRRLIAPPPCEQMCVPNQDEMPPPPPEEAVPEEPRRE